VPNIIQEWFCRAAIRHGGMENNRHARQGAFFRRRRCLLTAGAAGAGFAAAQSARGLRFLDCECCAPRESGPVFGSAQSSGSAAQGKGIGSPGSLCSSLLGLANAKLDGEAAVAKREDSASGKTQ